jgi:tetratricopeptide (TPR) repeat protein
MVRILLLLPQLAFAAQTLELHGSVQPKPRHGWVSLHAVESPFSTGSAIGPDGKFRFRDLKPGAYTVAASSEAGEARRTVEVVGAAADKEGRVRVDLRLEPSRSSRRHQVGAKELAVPPAAWKEYGSAQKRLARHDTEGGIENLKKAVEIAPHFTAAWNNLGTIAYQTRQFSLAEKYFRAALEQEPGAYEPTVNLGGVLLTLRRPDEALQYNRFAVKVRPEDALAQSQTGMNYFFLRDEDQAIGYLKEAKRLDPAHFSHPQLLLAEIYSRRGLRDRAASELEEFLEHHPETPEAGKMRELIKKLRAP